MSEQKTTSKQTKDTQTLKLHSFFYSAFSFDQKGAKEKSSRLASSPQIASQFAKKKSAAKGVSPSADGEEGYALSTAPPFEKRKRASALAKTFTQLIKMRSSL